MKKLTCYWRTAVALHNYHPLLLFIELLSVPFFKGVRRRKPQRLHVRLEGVPHDLYVRDGADIATLYEVFVLKEYAVSIPQPARIVDIGGHIGSATLFFATLYPEAKIFTYEPDPDSFKVLLKNTEKFQNVSCVNAAVNDVGGVVEFFVNKSSISSSLIERDGTSKMTVKAVALDTILSETIDLVKFDIEGAESIVFSSAKNIRNAKVYIGEVHLDLMSQDKKSFFENFTGYYVNETKINDSRLLVIFERGKAQKCL
ncbi:MAG: FkbM family methyltransferase [Candidatus Pacebacteria bacterium]|nr:FkbM family methyltransferase [Candidatus Paceibacterota bacterium]